MRKPIGYGVVGCGMMGREHLRNIALIADAHVAAIFEPDPEMRKQASALAPNAAMLDSLGAVLAHGRVDCLLIASPNHRHLPQLREIAARRPLPVLVEKPLFTDPADAADAWSFAQSYPAPAWVAMEYRYMPPVAKFLADADAATGGVKMLSIREHRYPFLPKVGAWNRFNRNTGGTLVEKCCHFFDLMRLILRSDPVRVAASAGQAVNHKDERYGGEAPDIWDHGYVVVDFESGARAMLELCMFAEGSRFQEEISAVGPRGKIECLVPGPARFWPAHLGEPPTAQVIASPRARAGPRIVPIPVDPVLLAAGDHNGSTFFQHRHFLRAVRGEAGVEVSLRDGWWAAATGMAAQAAARESRVVTVAPGG